MTALKLPKLYTSDKAIADATAKWGAAGQSHQAEAHVLALSVLQRFGKSHDIRIVAAFIKAMPEMSRVNSLKDWFAEFGPISFGEDGKTVTFVKDKPTTMGPANAMPFWKFSPEKAYVAMDPVKALQSLQKKLETDAKKTGKNHTALINALKAIKVTEHVAVITKPKRGKALAKAVSARKAKEAVVSPTIQ